MIRPLYILTGAALALAACTPAEQAGMMKLGPAPMLDGGSFSTGGGLTVALELRPIGGQTGICGVWAESDNQSVLSKGRAREVVPTGSVYLDGQVLHRDLGFLRKVDPSGSYAGLDANCIRTERPWRDADAAKAVQVRLPRQVVHREIEASGGSSFQVVFRQTGPGA